jgi:hypothetical protein
LTDQTHPLFIELDELITQKMSDPSFKAAVGLSREWDAYGAGVGVG